MHARSNQDLTKFGISAAETEVNQLLNGSLKMFKATYHCAYVLYIYTYAQIDIQYIYMYVCAHTGDGETNICILLAS